ncbi:hypothetical protein V6N13_067086 [Hibiscus sabdariffa]|uniref:Uncharacterized protein n=1 Tax=Hibiscus sabdariffa TaxID=183260 RepID=A0ABR2DU16_9ROSI
MAAHKFRSRFRKPQTISSYFSYQQWAEHAPKHKRLLTIEMAEFRTHVGNSSNVYISAMLNAGQALKKDISSIDIWKLGHTLPITTHITLHIPLKIVKPNNDSFLLIFPIRKIVISDAGSSDKAFNVTPK